MKTICFLMVLFFSTITLAQNQIELKGKTWTIKGEAQKEVYKGLNCIKTDKGSALANGVTFHNGIIEFDMCIQEGRGFAGLRFRGDGNNNTEEFYIRKHQSGNPDAMQYTPVFNWNAGWQLYYGNGYNALQKHIFDEWFHIKLAVSGTKGEVFIGDMATPILAIHELKMGDCEGLIEFYGPARFANISINEIDSPELVSEFKEPMPTGSETIQNYSLSNPTSSDILFSSNDIGNLISELEFKEVATESDGLLNISKFTPLTKEKNTVLLQIKVDAKEDIIKELKIAFSDAAKVYVNGKAVWMGVDVYRSRDYRFLGTIGYFDSLFLDLKKGENILSIAVAENFGGWGFKATFNDLKGIEIK